MVDLYQPNEYQILREGEGWDLRLYHLADAGAIRLLGVGITVGGTPSGAPALVMVPDGYDRRALLRDDDDDGARQVVADRGDGVQLVVERYAEGPGDLAVALVLINGRPAGPPTAIWEPDAEAVAAQIAAVVEASATLDRIGTELDEKEAAQAAASAAAQAAAPKRRKKKGAAADPQGPEGESDPDRGEA